MTAAPIRAGGPTDDVYTKGVEAAPHALSRIPFDSFRHGYFGYFTHPIEDGNRRGFVIEATVHTCSQLPTTSCRAGADGTPIPGRDVEESSDEPIRCWR